MNEKICCDLCGHEIIARVTTVLTKDLLLGENHGLKRNSNSRNSSENQIAQKTISYHCSNPDCRQEIGSEEDLESYKTSGDFSEFRMFKVFRELQDALYKLARLELEEKNAEDAIEAGKTLSTIHERLPIIIACIRKTAYNDFLEKIDIGSLTGDIPVAD